MFHLLQILVNCIHRNALYIDEMNIKLERALSHPIWKAHKPNESIYFMDGNTDRWQIVYYPIFQDGNTQEFYNEPRALVQNIDKGGFWSKEVPLRYLT